MNAFIKELLSIPKHVPWHTIKPFEDHCQIIEALKNDVKKLISTAKDKIKNSLQTVNKNITVEAKKALQLVDEHSLKLRKENAGFYNNKIQLLDELTRNINKTDSPKDIEQYNSLLNEIHCRQQQYDWKPVQFIYQDSFTGIFGCLENSEIYDDNNSGSDISDSYIQQVYGALWESKPPQEEVRDKKQACNNISSSVGIIENVPLKLTRQDEDDIPPPLPARPKSKIPSSIPNLNENVKSSSLFKKLKGNFLSKTASSRGKTSENISPVLPNPPKTEPEPLPTYNDECIYDSDGEYWSDDTEYQSNSAIQKRPLPPPPLPRRPDEDVNREENEYYDLSLAANDKKETNFSPTPGTRPPVPMRRKLPPSPLQPTAPEETDEQTSVNLNFSLANAISEAVKNLQMDKEKKARAAGQLEQTMPNSTVANNSQNTKQEIETSQPETESHVRFAGRTVIITGANSGIGKATAMELAKRGGRVILAVRDLKEGETALKEIRESSFNKNITVEKLDLADLSSVREFAENILQREKRLDVLVNNAAVMMCPKKLTKDGFEEQLGVNHLGHFLLTKLLLPKLQSHSGRIVNVTCSAFKQASINFDDLNSSKLYDKYSAYSQSKLANIYFTDQLVKRESSVKSMAANPGVAKTKIGRHISVWLSPVSSVFMQTAHAAAQTVIYCCVDPEVIDHSTFYYEKLKPADVEVDDQNSKRLWAISDRWTS
ncbi:DgyrCDS6331 [Dimorphilus gyrociliatus]|uniref:DgyrCDS6331 n=1 Tax=Dimorphilus gyrociliatus TaxID=2664684 RepID=A0A7I8VQ30_9ANNE|nr:DgyrCDS6331 [Dimorphilus gyrociliatus]